MSAPDYLHIAREAVRRVIIRLDHEAANIRRWLETEESTDVRDGLTQRAADLAEVRKKLEAMIGR